MDGFSMLLVAATFSSAASFSLGRVPMPTAPSAVRMSAIDDAEVSAHADRMHGLDRLPPCCDPAAPTLLRPASLCDLHAAGQGALACGERHAVLGRERGGRGGRAYLEAEDRGERRRLNLSSGFRTYHRTLNRTLTRNRNPDSG